VLDDALLGKVRLSCAGWLHYGTVAGGRDYGEELVNAHIQREMDAGRKPE
jgi:hypothetical protein